MSWSKVFHVKIHKLCHSCNHWFRMIYQNVRSTYFDSIAVVASIYFYSSLEATQANVSKDVFYIIYIRHRVVNCSSGRKRRKKISICLSFWESKTQMLGIKAKFTARNVGINIKRNWAILIRDLRLSGIRYVFKSKKSVRYGDDWE